MDEKIGHEIGSYAYRQGILLIYVEGHMFPSTSQLRWFKLTSTSQAYWRADLGIEALTKYLWDVLCN